jgi:Ser/Thr protein kinase RdoA (MazF antagonist)
MPRNAAVQRRAAPFVHRSGVMRYDVQEIVRRLDADDPLRLGAPAGWTATRLENRRYSSIHLLAPTTAGDAVRERTGSDALVLKCYRAAQAERRRREFADLERVHGALGGGVARPVACYPELGALITARAAGRPLGPLVRHALRRGGDARTLAQAAAHCAAAGAWLRRFQAAGAGALRGVRPAHLSDAAAFIAYVDERLRLLEHARPGIDAALRNRLLAHVAAGVQVLPARVFADVTWSHSDFGPHNVLADGDRITVLDFELLPQHPCFDAAYFVECLAGHVGPWVDPARVRRLERAFLAGYGEPMDATYFALLRLRHLVCTYTSESRRGGLAALLRWRSRAALRSRLQRVTTLLAIRTHARAA